MKPLTPLLLCLLLFSPALHSQNTPTKHLKYETLTINDGLSQGLVNCMLQDRYGFMWFGTKDGLNRYDGYQFTIFRHDARDESSIGGNYINSLFEDAQGRLWISTMNNGLDLFKRETESFIHFTPSDADSAKAPSTPANDQYRITGLSSKIVWGINEDQKGNIWVCTSNGLDVITIKGFHSASPSPFGEGVQRTDEEGEEPVLSLSKDVRPVPIFSSGRADEEKKAKGEREQYSIINTNIHQVVYAITVTRNGKIYLHGQWDVLYQIRNDEQSLDFHHLQLDTITSSSFDFSSVKEKVNHVFTSYMLQDTFKNQTWFFDGSSFICVDDRDNKVLKVVRVSDRTIQFNSGVIDSSGSILFSLDYALKEFNTQTGMLTNIEFDGVNENKINRGVSSVMIDRSGTLWITTNGYGLVKHNVSAEKFHHTGDVSVFYIAPAPNNCVYIPFEQLYCTFDPQRDAFTDTIPQNQLPSFGNGFDLYSVPRLDDSKHRRLMGLAEKLYCYDYATKTGIEYKLPVKATGELSEFQQQILEDHSGIIWIATRAGLFRFDEANQSWKRYTNVQGDTTSLSADIAFSLCLDPQQPEKYLWVGTDGGGLDRMDMTTGRFISYTTHDGLPNNVVYGVLNDDEGNLWLSTNKGLSRFTPPHSHSELVSESAESSGMLKQVQHDERGAFKNYEDKDGLQSNEFNHRAFCRLPNGLLFFGGVNGFNYFNPKDLHENSYTPDVLITDVRIRNKPVSFREKKSPLTAPAYLAKQITLPYSENMITFEFASMDFSRPSKNLFQYKLEGFDHDWVQSGTNHSATYTNLDPGTYTFFLKGSNSDGVWNEEPTSMQLTILPPWYMTWWFRVLVFLTIAGMLYAIYRYRLAQALKLQEVRNRIASDLHDEIGSNLSSISIFSQVANEKSDHESPELSSWLKKINEYTQSSLDAINDIVWVINSRNDRFENIISRMRILAAELLEARNYQLQMSLDESLSEVKLGMEERKNFYLIYKEALNNIVKYANCKTVKIELKWNRPVVHLRIIDDGVGFDTTTVEHGNGLLNMQKRAETLRGSLSIHSVPGEGTSVELDFNA